MSVAGRATGPGAGGWVTGVRWAGRLLALLLVLMVLAFLVGEGVSFRRLTASEWIGMGALAALCAGLLLGWTRERAGGVLVLGALAIFCANELAGAGHLPRGWVWPLLGVPGVLYLVSASARGGHGRRDSTA